MKRVKTYRSLMLGFTLIELLIVVAIIAILAAIAVPNFLEAQVRSKVSRAKSDLRTMKVANEAYYVDYNKYINCFVLFDVVATDARQADSHRMDKIGYRLTTPVAFLTSIPGPDPFSDKNRLKGQFWAGTNCYFYTNMAYKLGAVYDPSLNRLYGQYAKQAYTFWSNGPDGEMGGANWYALWYMMGAGKDPYALGQIYDPTNGTVSYGDICAFGGETSAPSMQ